MSAHPGDRRAALPGQYSGAEATGPAIDLEEFTDGQDADQPTGPYTLVGDPVNRTHLVSNSGDLPPSNSTVTDDQGVAATCPNTPLLQANP